MKKVTTLAGLITVSAAIAAYAHGGATGIVKERMDGMSAMSAAIKVVTPMMQGTQSFDVEAVSKAAEKIGSHAGETMTKLFPQGSGGAPSAAKSKVWEDWDEFASLAERLHTYSEGLALAAGNGMSSADPTATAGAMMGGASTMMGGGVMAEGTMGREELAEMPVDAVFAMVSQTCSACHTKFRTEAK